MQRAFATFLSVALVAALAAAPAQAGGRVLAQGYKLTVPPEFQPLETTDRSTCISSQLRLTGGLSVKGEPDVRVYYAGLSSRPDAVLVSARINLADGCRLDSRLDLQRYVLDNLRLSQEEFDALAAEGGVKLTPSRRGEYDALEMSHDGSRGALGLLNEPATRALTVVGGKFVIVIVLMVVDDSGLPVEETWQRISRSLILDPPGAFMGSILIYAGAGLAALILLVFVLRLRAQRRRRMPPWAHTMIVDTTPQWDDEGAMAPALTPELHPAGGPPDGMPPCPSGAPTMGMPVVQPAPALPPVHPHAPPPDLPPTHPHMPPAHPGGLKSSLEIHRHDHPEAPQAPDVTLLSPDDEPVPTETPGHAEAHPVPPSDLERPVAPKAPAPQRKGLIRTRPDKGRFSDAG